MPVKGQEQIPSKKFNVEQVAKEVVLLIFLFILYLYIKIPYPVYKFTWKITYFCGITIKRDRVI